MLDATTCFEPNITAKRFYRGSTEFNRFNEFETAVLEQLPTIGGTSAFGCKLTFVGQDSSVQFGVGHPMNFFPRVRTPCGHGAQVIVEGRESQSDGGCGTLRERALTIHLVLTTLAGDEAQLTIEIQQLDQLQEFEDAVMEQLPVIGESGTLGAN